VFPDQAAQAAAEIEARLAAGEYDDLGEAALAERLTGQLYAVCADKHLRVHVHPERRRPPPRPVDRDKPRQDMRAIGRLDSFGIHRVERLEGNVGYVDLRRVALPQNAGASIAPSRRSGALRPASAAATIYPDRLRLIPPRLRAGLACSCS
jgi:hypothetical protein